MSLQRGPQLRAPARECRDAGFKGPFRRSRRGRGRMCGAEPSGTIRGDFSVDDSTAANRDKRAIHNLVHASETPEEATHEINFWFAPEEIHDYKRAEEDIMF